MTAEKTSIHSPYHFTSNVSFILLMKCLEVLRLHDLLHLDALIHAKNWAMSFICLFKCSPEGARDGEKHI